MTPEAKRRTWRDALRRGAILGVVLALHLVAMGFFWLWVANSSYDLQSDASIPAQVLHVTLLDDSPTLPPPTPTQPQRPWEAPRPVTHSAASKPRPPRAIGHGANQGIPRPHAHT